MERESRTLEWKVDVSRSFLKTVSAYANYGTGRIVFGVNDQGEAIGLADPVKTSLTIENMVNDCIDPVPVFRLAIDKETDTVTLLVQEGPHTPYLYQGKAYQRSDASTIAVDRIEFGRLVLAGTNQTYDELDAKRQDLTFDLLTQELQGKLGLKEVSLDTLRTLGLYSPQGGYTNAAELLADTNGFPGVDLVRYGASTQEILERKTVAGVSVLQQLNQAMDFFQRYYTYEKIEGFHRVPKELVPEEAFRETMANALIHRAWDTSANIVVNMHSDRIEITSPGPLPPKISEAEYLEGNVSVMRNQILAMAFLRLGHIELLGSGIGRIRSFYQGTGARPSFSIRPESIMVTLPTLPQSDVERALPYESGIVLDSMPLGTALRRADIVRRCSLPERAVLNSLNSLQKRGLVERVGAGPSTKYLRL